MLGLFPRTLGFGFGVRRLPGRLPRTLGFRPLSVNASSDSVNLSAQFGKDTAEIETAGKTILVQPTALVVDGVKVADIDKGVADVHVDVKRGVVSFVADGKPVELLRR